MYKTLGFKWLIEVFCPASAFATADSDEARNPQRFIHVSVGRMIQNPPNDFNIDNADYIYGTGAPDDPNAIILHKTTQGQLKQRLLPNGMNDAFVGQCCLIMLFEHWEDTRRKIATLLGQKPEELKADIFGDIRLLRNDLIHNFSRASKNNSTRLKLIPKYSENQIIVISNEMFDFIVIQIFNYFNSLIMSETGIKPYLDNSLSLRGREEHLRTYKTSIIKN
jgi:hypothetical protein